MKEKDRLRLEALNAKLQNYMDHPWIMRCKPFHVVGSIYFLGNNYVSSYLIDTGDGLVLIDTAFQETAYLLFDNIRALGFNPADIRYLFLSHGHVDHCGAARLVQEYCGCRIYLGERDHFFFTERPDLILFENHVPRFRIDDSYDYTGPTVIGNTKFTMISTPGHTPGTTTFLIETVHNGRPVTCAMHGGLGINGLTRDELAEKRLPLSLQTEFVDSLNMLKTRRVDVVLPSHSHQYDLIGKAALDDGSGEVFFDRENGWVKMLDHHIALMDDIMKE